MLGRQGLVCVVWSLPGTRTRARCGIGELIYPTYQMRATHNGQVGVPSATTARHSPELDYWRAVRGYLPTQDFQDSVRKRHDPAVEKSLCSRLLPDREPFIPDRFQLPGLEGYLPLMPG